MDRTVDAKKEIGEIVSAIMTSNNGLSNEYFSKIADYDNKNSTSELLDVEDIIKSVSASEEIEKILLSTETTDDGGIIAMSGFYYQLLITIHYIVEMFQGKWTNIVVDHHQDIIAYNDTTIRFIQVKTKNVSYCSVSDTKAYSEWIPKLLANQNMFEGYNYKLEFELVSNCLFLEAPKVCKDFESFYNNHNFENGFIDGDLFKRTIENMSRYNLDESKVTKGIKAFRVKHMDPIYIHRTLCYDIGECFNEYYRANNVVIDMIISHLFRKCYLPENASIQIVGKEDSGVLKELIRNEIKTVAERDVIDTSEVEVLGQFIEEIKQQYMGTGMYDEFLIVVDEFEKELLNYFSNSEIESIFTLLNKYLNKTLNTSYFRVSKNELLKKESERVFKILLFVKLYFGGEIIIDSESKKLLLINISSQPFNIFGIKEELAYTVEEFIEVFQGLNFEEQFAIVNNPSFKIILAGEFDNDCDPVDTIEVICKEIPEVSSLLESEYFHDESIARVKNVIAVVDSEDRKIDGIHRKRKSYDNIDKIRQQIKEKINFEKN